MANFLKNLLGSYEIKRRAESHKLRNGIAGLLALAGLAYVAKKLMNKDTRAKVSDKISSVIHRGGNHEKNATTVPATNASAPF